MGIDYKIVCSSCEKCVDAYSSQMWGNSVGMKDAIRVMKFIVKHDHYCMGHFYLADNTCDTSFEYDRESYDKILPELNQKEQPTPEESA